jgi:hypothetical protein
MSQSDKGTRETAIPFVANPFGLNIGLPNQSDSIQIFDGTSYIATTALRVVRLTKPERGNLIQAYLNLFMAVSPSLTAKIAIGRFDTDGITAVIPTQAEIDAGHLRLTGTNTPIASSGGALTIDGINLVSLIPKKGEANYSADGFVLIVQFSRDLTSSDAIRRFEVSCSMQMGLL